MVICSHGQYHLLFLLILPDTVTVLFSFLWFRKFTLITNLTGQIVKVSKNEKKGKLGQFVKSIPRLVVYLHIVLPFSFKVYLERVWRRNHKWIATEAMGAIMGNYIVEGRIFAKYIKRMGISVGGNLLFVWWNFATKGLVPLFEVDTDILSGGCFPWPPWHLFEPR